MKRLTETYYDEFGIKHTKIKENVEKKTYRSYTWTPQEIANDKLAEFEDFMEKQGFESLGDLKNALLIKLTEEKVKEIAMEEMRKEIKNNIAQIFQKEVPELYKYKDRWDKLKEWIKEQNNPIDNLVISDDETKYLYMSDILDEMQELEEE